MRTEEEVQRFYEDQIDQFPEVQAIYYTACYEGCIPRQFWSVSSEQVRFNKDVFRGPILNYCKKWRRARRHGYGLILTGSNGGGKTFFSCFVLTQMIKRECSVYYTTSMQLDIDLKRGFRDAIWERRLDSMLESDFLVIDELGKEKGKDDGYFRARLELLLKSRCDNGDPTIIVTNLDDEAIVDMYGDSVQSIFNGKYETVMLKHGDYRRALAVRRQKTMGSAK